MKVNKGRKIYIIFYDENLYILNVKNDLEAKVKKYDTF